MRDNQVIEVEELRVCFRLDRGVVVDAVKGISFHIDKGETVALVGESGSGKTTFLRCLAGLEEVTSGKIELNGKILNDSNTLIQSHKRKIGFVFQDYPLFPHLDVTENISQFKDL